MGLYQRLRPKDWDEIIGQDHVVNPLRKMVEEEKLPSLILLGGVSGVGKTTIARIICNKLVTNPSLNFIEINAATDGGIDKVRNIQDQMRPVPLGSKYKIWLLDEVHQSSRQFQEGFLKETEDTPDHVKFIFSSSEPDKLIRAIQTRASRFDLKPLSDNDMGSLVYTAIALEKIDISEKVIDEIIAASEGSARQALVLLEQAASGKNDREALEIVQRAGPNKESYNFCQILLKGTWEEAVKAIKANETEPERVRRGVLGYMSSVLLNSGGKNQRAINALRRYQFLFVNGKPDLILATWEFFHSK